MAEFEIVLAKCMCMLNTVLKLWIRIYKIILISE
jgi:hypothetical protein